MRAAITKTWPAGEHSFRLGIGELRGVEQRCEAGCAVVLSRLLGQAWKVDDVLQPLRLGLIGAGMVEREAQKLVDAALTDSSLYALSIPAADIIQHFLLTEGKDDQLGERQAGAESQTQTRSPTEGSDGPDITGSEPQSA